MRASPLPFVPSFFGRHAPGAAFFPLFGGAPRLALDFFLPGVRGRELFALLGKPGNFGLLRRRRFGLLPFLFCGQQGGRGRRFPFGRFRQAPFLRETFGAGRCGLFPQGFRAAHGLFRFARQLFGGQGPGVAIFGGLADGFAFGFPFGGGLGQGVLARQFRLSLLAPAFGLDGVLLGLAGLENGAPFDFFALVIVPVFRLPDLRALPCGRFRADQRNHVWAARHVRGQCPSRRRGPRFGAGVRDEGKHRPNSGVSQLDPAQRRGRRTRGQA